MSDTALGLLGGTLFLVGLLFGRVFTANFELDVAGKVRKALGVLAVTVGVLLVMRGLGLLGAPAHPAGEAIHTLADAERVQQAAREQGRPLLIDFTAAWCKACKDLDARTFSDAAVAERLGRWSFARVDLTSPGPELRAVEDRFEVVGLPTVAFVDAAGRIRSDLRLTEFEAAEPFLARLQKVEAGAAADAGSLTLAQRIHDALDSGSLWVYVLMFLAGIAASLSPCVYPLIPITLSLFGARAATTRLRGFLLSVTYVLGIAVTYSTLGAVAAGSGQLFGEALQSVWVTGGVAVVFAAMGLSMLGAFEIRIPAFVNDRLNQVGGGEGGRWLGVFAMGSVAGVIAAPCVGPPLVAALTFIGKRADVMLGVRLLSVYALGMGLLFIVLGTFTQLLARLPRSGGWMEAVKGSLGIVMLVVGAVYLYDLLPRGT